MENHKEQDPENGDTYEEEGFESIDSREQKESKNRFGRLLLWVGGAIVAIAVVGGIVYALFTGNGEEEETEPVRSNVTVTETTVEPEEEEEEDSGYIVPDDSFLGYWNRSGHKDEELAISEITEVYVTFNIWWKDLYEAADVKAYFASDHTASFSCDENDVILIGKLYFMRDEDTDKNSVMMEITRSDVKEIPTGTLTFTEKHEEPWFEAVATFASEDTSNAEYWGEGDLILPDSATKELTEEDIKDLTLEEVQYAIAEIYARHQCKFDDAKLQEYFDSKWWYDGYIEQKDFSEDVFNDYEFDNVVLLKQREAQLGGTGTMILGQ